MRGRQEGARETHEGSVHAEGDYGMLINAKQIGYCQTKHSVFKMVSQLTTLVAALWSVVTATWALFAHSLVTIAKMIQRTEPRRNDDDSTMDLPLPPGNMGYPIIGETIQFLTTCHTGKFFQDRYSKYGPIFRTNFLGMNNIHVSDLSHVKKILLGEHHLVSVFWPPAMTKLLGHGSLATSVEGTHRRLRRCAKQVMNFESLKEFIPVMTRCISEELERWTHAGRIDVYDCAKNLTMKTACEVMFGLVQIDDSVVMDLANNFVAYGKGFFQLPLPLPGSTFLKAVQAKQHILDTLANLGEQGLKRSSVLGYFFSMHGSEMMSPTEKSNLTVEMLFGAQETTACTITCAMYLLERHPNVLHRLRAEIEQHISTENGCGDGGPWQGIEHLHSIRYLSSVIKETLRLFPPIGGGFRKVLKTFEIGGYRIPRDWTVTYSIKDIHDGSDLDDVTQFNPDNWGTDPENNLHFSHFLPFGAGARVCVGKEYAKLFIKLTLISLVTNHNWSLISKSPTFLRVPIVRPAEPMMADFVKR